jgi:hypothetical protein
MRTNAQATPPAISAPADPFFGLVGLSRPGLIGSSSAAAGAEVGEFVLPAAGFGVGFVPGSAAQAVSAATKSPLGLAGTLFLQVEVDLQPVEAHHVHPLEANSEVGKITHAAQSVTSPHPSCEYTGNAATSMNGTSRVQLCGTISFSGAGIRWEELETFGRRLILGIVVDPRRDNFCYRKE